MKTVPAHAAPAHLADVRRSPSLVADYFALTKPRLNFLVVLTSAAGYYLGAPTRPEWLPMAQAVIGTALVAGGAAVLNQVYERDTDALMRRTRMRPLPDRRLNVGEARVYGLVLSSVGVAILALTANLQAAALAIATLFVYLVVYTPMKRRSPAATLVGAVPGALPPLIGWAAARGSLTLGGWVLFAIVFLWQIPHFMAIAWLCREDYGNAGFPMLPVIEPDGRRTARQALIYSLLLLPASLAASFTGVSGFVYFWIAFALGGAMIWLSARFVASRTEPAARALFFGSITYLPLLWAAMILNH